MANSPDYTAPPFGSEKSAAAEDAVNRATQSAHEIVDRVAEKAGPAVDRLRTSVDSASEAVHSGVEDLTEMQERWVEASRACVRDHPLVSIGVAVAAGMLLSRLMAR